MTTYIVIARNTYHGDQALYGVADWTVEARSPREAATIARNRWPDLASEYLAVVPARYFTEVAP